MFAPAIGVDEDTVNGNSSGCLGAYLLQTHTPATTELHLRVHQGQSLNRAGIVLVKAQWADGEIKTTIGGTALVTNRKQIHLDV